jgi:hypothetical protein
VCVCDMGRRFCGSQNRSLAAVTRNGNGPFIPAECGPTAVRWAVPCVSKGKVHPVAGHEAQRGSRGIALLFL